METKEIMALTGGMRIGECGGVGGLLVCLKKNRTQNTDEAGGGEGGFSFVDLKIEFQGSLAYLGGPWLIDNYTINWITWNL